MSSLRRELHRIVDELKPPALRQMAAYARALQAGTVLPWDDVRDALGEPGPPIDGESDLDTLLTDAPGLSAQLSASMDDLKSGRPFLRHADVVRRVRNRL